MKILLVVIDTLRADHLGCYGYEKNTSKNIDRLAKEGVIFDRAYASDVPTQPSFTGLFTGQRGISTGIVSHSRTEHLTGRESFLPEILAINGFKTGAVSTLFYMKSHFARGYNVYMNPIAGSPRRVQQVVADEINEMAIPWLKANYDRDFFLFVHYWDPHCIYKPPLKYRNLYYQGDKSDPDNHSLDGLKGQVIESFSRGHLDAIADNITDAEYVIAQYDGEITYADDKFGELLVLLEELGIYDDTFIIVTSDHGESMTEHKLFFDHFGIYEPTVRIPLIMKYSSELPQRKRRKALVQNIDVAPTILEFSGIEKPKQFDGISLFSLSDRDDDVGRHRIFTNQGLWQAKRAMRKERWKFIKTFDNNLWDFLPMKELYDLDKDPAEEYNLIDEEKDLAKELELELKNWEDEKLGKRLDPLRLIVSIGLQGIPPPLPEMKRARDQKEVGELISDLRRKIDAPKLYKEKHHKNSA